MHQNQRQPLLMAIASVRSATSANSQAPPGRPSANPPAGSTSKRLDRTSRPAIRANVPMPSHPHCSEVCRNVPSRRSDERGPRDQTRDATDRELPDAPSHGRSVVAFYNVVHPHKALGYRSPREFRVRVKNGDTALAVDAPRRAHYSKPSTDRIGSSPSAARSAETRNV